LVNAKEFTLNLAQAAATYDICTASGGDVLVMIAAPFVSVAAVGLVSDSIQSNNTTPDIIMAAGVGLLGSLTAGKNMAPFATAFVLPSGKKLQHTIVGTGSGGTILLAVQYMRLAAGADIA